MLGIRLDLLVLQRATVNQGSERMIFSTASATSMDAHPALKMPSTLGINHADPKTCPWGSGCMKCIGIVGNSWAGRLISCLHVNDCEMHPKSDARKDGVSDLDVRSVPVTEGRGVRHSGENRCSRAVQRVARWFMELRVRLGLQAHNPSHFIHPSPLLTGVRHLVHPPLITIGTRASLLILRPPHHRAAIAHPRCCVSAVADQRNGIGSPSQFPG
jgi:hypothetical protein